MRGRLITLEGGEGAGKSTCMDAVVGVLENECELPVVVTREPGGPELSERIREMVLSTEMQMQPLTELLLVFAARSENVSQTIRPALERGSWVVCDRFTDASYAYQGGGRGVDAARIAILADWAHGDVQADLTLLLDVDPEVGMRRATRDRAADRMEIEQAEFYQRVRQTYLNRADQEPTRFSLIDAGLPLDEVAEAARVAVRELVNQ